MKLTSQQVAFFQTFGYVVLPSLFTKSEVSDITADFEKVLDNDRKGAKFKGDKRQAVLAFVEKTETLRSLVSDDRIFLPISQLLGEEFVWVGSDGNLYVGDTAWHPDADDDVGLKRIKVAMYLDPVTENSGCLRVIPGSHENPLHNRLRPLRYWRIKQAVSEGRGSIEDEKKFLDDLGLDLGDEAIFGVNPEDLPSAPLESEPGDVVMFNQYCFHSAFGGKTGRRMFTMNFAEAPKTESDFDYFRNLYEGRAQVRKALQYTDDEKDHVDEFLYSENPRVQGMLKKLKERNLT